MTLQLEKELDKGEAESIALAYSIKADYLLIDEIKGRTIAEKLGLKIVGLIGVLIEAKNKNIISTVKPLLDHRLHFDKQGIAECTEGRQ